MQSVCQEEGAPAHAPPAARGGPAVSECVGHRKHAKWRDQHSCLRLLRSKAAATRGPAGLLRARPQQEERQWLVSQPRCTEKQSTGQRGQSWEVEWWSLGWPLALWIGTRNEKSLPFQMQSLWTCFRRQSLMLKTQRMGNSRGLSFKIDFCDPLIVRYCKVTLRVS